MRVLFATDGSEAAAVARDAVASLPWPDGTTIRAVAIVESVSSLIGAPLVPVVPSDVGDIETGLLEAAEATLTEAQQILAADGRTVETALVRGRPASAIVDEAAAFDADLVIIGSRGQGAIATMLLGSVSAEVVDHAPCPVLVVRAPLHGPVLFGDDGSASARTAEVLLTAWPILLNRPLTVAVIAETVMPMTIGIVPGLTDAVLESYSESVDEALSTARAEASATAHRLGRQGYDATAVVRSGDAAREIVELARTGEFGLIVLGTRGRTGLRRILLGSVARNVLLHAPCSVLVVRETVRIRPESGGEVILSDATPPATLD